MKILASTLVDVKITGLQKMLKHRPIGRFMFTNAAANIPQHNTWDHRLKETARIGQAGTRSMLPSFALIGKLLSDL
jgi:hypothetical protein